MFPPAYSLVFFDFEGLVVVCIVRIWRQGGLQGCLDTDWIHSFIIRQIGWSRCGLCKSRTGSCSEPIPFLPHPTVKSTETLCVLDALGQKKKDHSSSFSLSDLYWGVGLFTHTEFDIYLLNFGRNFDIREGLLVK